MDPQFRNLFPVLSSVGFSLFSGQGTNSRAWLYINHDLKTRWEPENDNSLKHRDESCLDLAALAFDLESRFYIDRAGIRPRRRIGQPNRTIDDSPQVALASSFRHKKRFKTAYQIQVASDPSKFDGPDLWDTGVVRSSNFSALYCGQALGSRSIGWWRIKDWDAGNDPSAWSAATHFELGLLNQSDWTAS